MESYGKEFLLAFLPLFVAIDAIGTLPLILGIIQEIPFKQRARITNIALLTATSLGFAFLFLGKWILRFLGIEVEHFAIAGGLVLLVLAIKDIVGSGFIDVPEKQEMLGVVPLGTPLTAGPATLATLLLLTDRYGVGVVAPAFLVNIGIAWLVFTFGPGIARILGKGGLRALSKISSLLLGAIAARLILGGLKAVFNPG